MNTPELDNLVKEVSETKDVMQSAVTFIAGLSATIKDVRSKLADQGVVNRQLDDLSKDLDANQQALAKAIADNTDTPPADGGGGTDTGGGTTDTGGGGTTDTGGGGTTDAGGGV